MMIPARERGEPLGETLDCAVMFDRDISGEIFEQHASR